MSIIVKDKLGNELAVGDMIFRAYTAYRSAETEFVYIDRLPDKPKGRMRIRNVKPNSAGEYPTSNVDPDPSRMLKMPDEYVAVIEH